MTTEENESQSTKIDNPLTPKQDNSWAEAIPKKVMPWDKPAMSTSTDKQDDNQLPKGRILR